MDGIIGCAMLVIIGAFVLVAAFALLTLTEIITPKEVCGWLKGKKRKAVKVVRCKIAQEEATRANARCVSSAMATLQITPTTTATATGERGLRMADYSKTCLNCACDGICDHNVNGWETCGNWISMDAVSVVRCKDCKYGELYLNSQGAEYVVCSMDEHHVWLPNGFCSYGEQEG